MKLAKGSLLVIGAIILLTSLAVAGDRMVLGEMFTNTSCGPCYQPELLLDQFAVDYSDYLALIRYHVWWPSSGDPYYQFDISEATQRNNYYANNYTPHLFVDGNIDGHETYSGWSALIENESANYSAVSMTLTGNYNPDTDTGTVTVDIIVEQDPGANNLKLRVALTESDIHWNAPNGIRVHNQTFRDMIPSAGGQAVTLVQGDTLEYTFTFVTRSPINYENCQLIAFIQSDQTRNVIQAAKIGVPDMFQVGIDDNPAIPQAFNVAQNYPNPFNARTLIGFTLPQAGDATVNIYNITGQLVETLGGHFEAGHQTVTWDASKASSGVYFYKVTSGDLCQTMKMTLLK